MLGYKKKVPVESLRTAIGNVWAAASPHLHNYREAVAATASVGGDVDTNCAIVGGIVVSPQTSDVTPHARRYDGVVFGLERIPRRLVV